MGRRKLGGGGLVGAFLDLGLKLPWWINLLLALGSYAVLHHWAVKPIPADNAHHMAANPGWQLVRTLAQFGQYAVSVLFVLATLIGLSKREFAPPISGFRVSPELEPSADSSISPAWTHGLNSQPRPVKPTQWSIELLQELDWKRFEQLCAEYFRVCGFDTVMQAQGPDGGIDIKLYPKGMPSKLENLVQCKQWSNRIVGVRDVRALLGSMTAAKVGRGTFVTSSRFSLEAVNFADQNKIHLIDGAEFIRRILARPTPEQQELLEFATSGDYKTPSCPSCGKKLIERRGKATGKAFWACPGFPGCRFILRKRRKTDAGRMPGEFLEY